MALVLRQMLLHHLSSAPALVPLENDLRCGPLFPGESLSSRIRFLALREGVHKLEKLRITGQGDDFDFVMRWVPLLRVSETARGTDRNQSGAGRGRRSRCRRPIMLNDDHMHLVSTVICTCGQCG